MVLVKYTNVNAALGVWLVKWWCSVPTVPPRRDLEQVLHYRAYEVM